MTDTTEQEQEAIMFASSCAGEYLESINVFDVRNMTREQWVALMQVVCLNYSRKKAELN